PTVKVAIHGHTDNVGDAKENLLLSENRAKAVFNYLILEDINPARLSFKGFGSTKPIANNNTDEGKAKNRRTEFVVVGK
ncbi:MAG: OmpA family protein, partial [Flavobacteriales bacterium]|nr:OmpA family protein [Flavobacteriales bacterium]